MTRGEALAESQKRWGEMDGTVWETPDIGLGLCCVGKWIFYGLGEKRQHDHVHFIEYGQGDKWEDAFADADRRAAAGHKGRNEQ